MLGVGNSRQSSMKRISAFWILVAGSTATSVAGADVAYAAKLAAEYNRQVCHSVDKKLVGPAFREIGKKYSGDATVAATLQGKVKNASTGTWGSIPMPPANVPEPALVALVEWILSLK
jgi:cytochrome c